MPRKKDKGKTSIAIAVSLDGLLKKDYKIVMAHTVGSMVTLTTWGGDKKAGMNYIPNRVLKQMFENSGQKATEVTQENGND